MDTRRLTLIATVAVIALIFVGIGYAYVAYTSNGGNHSDNAYLTITQVGDTGYTFADHIKVEIETYNEEDDGTFFYKLASTDTIVTGDKIYAVEILGSITLHAEIHGDTAPSKLVVSIASSTEFDATEKWQYFLTDAPNDQGKISKIYAYKDTGKDKDVWTPVQGSDIIMNTVEDKTLYVCYGYDIELTEAKIGQIKFIDEKPNDLIDASIVFKVDSKSIVTYNANNGDSPATQTVELNGTVKNYQFIDKPASFQPPQDKPYFLGWNSDKDADKPLATGQTITSDITFYAIWSSTEPQQQNP